MYTEAQKTNGLWSHEQKVLQLAEERVTEVIASLEERVSVLE